MEKSLEQIIAGKIRRDGPIPFETFMEMALYYPGLGYYTSARTEIGRMGDFYTSPHLHPIFGAMLGRQVVEMWEAMGRPARFDVVEAGGGRGYLCMDVLDYLKGSPLYGKITYTLVELNARIVQRQKELLAEHLQRMRWARGLDELDGIRGVVLSNELFDAFPVRVVEQSGGLKEVYVSLDGDGFTETLREPGDPAIEEYLGEFSVELAERQRAEVNLRMRDWLGAASDALAEGFVVTVDYGYPAEELYGEDRNRGTLLCYHRHRASENPYVNVGAQDITAHINFSALRKWGDELGLRGIGFVNQGLYLVSLGIDELITSLYAGSPAYGREVSKIKGLIMPGTMGDTHKVLVQYKGEGKPRLRGFGMKNRLASL